MTTTKSRGIALVLVVALFCFSLTSGFAQTDREKGKVNINTAGLSELETLPRIGPKVAQRIIDFRTENGEFKRIEEIMKVKGIGEKIFEGIKDLITVGSEK